MHTAQLTLTAKRNDVKRGTNWTGDCLRTNYHRVPLNFFPRDYLFTYFVTKALTCRGPVRSYYDCEERETSGTSGPMIDRFIMCSFRFNCGFPIFVVGNGEIAKSRMRMRPSGRKSIAVIDGIEWKMWSLVQLSLWIISYGLRAGENFLLYVIFFFFLSR